MSEQLEREIIRELDAVRRSLRRVEDLYKNPIRSKSRIDSLVERSTQLLADLDQVDSIRYDSNEINESINVAPIQEQLDRLSSLMRRCESAEIVELILNAYKSIDLKIQLESSQQQQRLRIREEEDLKLGQSIVSLVLLLTLSLAFYVLFKFNAFVR